MGSIELGWPLEESDFVEVDGDSEESATAKGGGQEHGQDSGSTGGAAVLGDEERDTCGSDGQGEQDECIDGDQGGPHGDSPRGVWSGPRLGRVCGAGCGEPCLSVGQSEMSSDIPGQTCKRPARRLT